MLYYKPAVDGASAAYVDLKSDNDLSAIQRDLDTLLLEVKHNRRLSPEPSVGPPPIDTLNIEASPPPSTSLQVVNHHHQMVSQTSPTTDPSRPADDNHRLLEQVRSACQGAGAVLDIVSSTTGSAAIEGETISGRYANTSFQVVIQGISGETFDPENFFVVWREPRNVNRSILPGIRFLINAVDAAISSIKYVETLQQVGRSNP